MIRYYFFINTEFTTVFKKDDKGNYEQISYNDIYQFNNTLKFNFETEEIEIAYEDKYFMNNRYAIIGDDSVICGCTVNVIFKMGIYLYDLFNLLKINNSEIAVIFEEDAIDCFESYRIDIYKVMDNVFNVLCNSENLITYKGCFLLNSLKLGLEKYMLHQYKNGVAYINNFFLGLHINKGKKGTLVGHAEWAKQNIEEKNECNNEFYKYLELNGFSINQENIENIKNYVIYETLKNKELNKVKIIVKDEEYYLDFQVINQFVQNNINNNIKRLNEELEKLGTDTKDVIIFVNITNKEVEEKILSILNEKNMIIADKQQYDDFFKKLIIYIDLVIKYNNVVYRKKITQLLNSKYHHQIRNNIIYDGYYAYGLNNLLDERNNDIVFKELGIKKSKFIR